MDKNTSTPGKMSIVDDTGEQLRLYADIVCNMPVGMMIYHWEDCPGDHAFFLTALNPKASTLLGSRESDLIGKSMEEIFPSFRSKGIPQAVAHSIQKNKLLQFDDIASETPPGKKSCFSYQVIPLPQHHAALLFEDITERKQMEEAIRQSLKEKELLLREIHHRVKNNLAMVSSLLNIQSGYLKDNQARAAFAESRKRINSIALIHEKLYRSSDIVNIELNQYIHDLSQALIKSSSIPPDNVEFRLEIEKTYFDADFTIPIGLILTEIITNSLKYAYRDQKKLIIHIGLKSENGFIHFFAGDNGPGIDRNLDWRSTETLGIQLIILLAEQLDGKIQLDRENGTAFRIVFPIPSLNPAKKRGHSNGKN